MENTAMKNKRPFDEEVFQKTKQERENLFNNFVLIHPKLTTALKEIKKEIYTSGNYDVIVIVGPSGVGKTKLLEETVRSIYIEMADELKQDKSIIPLVGIELPNPDLGRFNWKDFYYRVLMGINEPLIDKKIDYRRIIEGRPKERISMRKAGAAPELRRSIEDAFYYRKTRALLIDEAQHFFNTGRGLDMQFNSIKSLANMCNTKIVLFGTYQLNPFINSDGQLSRRVYEIHFPRYDYEIKKDREIFTGLVYQIQKMLPIEEEPNLVQHIEYIYEHSIGCVGILKKWLQRCLSDALTNNETTITFDNLKRNSLNTKKLVTLANEATIGENQYKDNPEDITNLKILLGIKRENQEHKPKGNSTPGKRNPTRDPVN